MADSITLSALLCVCGTRLHRQVVCNWQGTSNRNQSFLSSEAKATMEIQAVSACASTALLQRRSWRCDGQGPKWGAMLYVMWRRTACSFKLDQI